MNAFLNRYFLISENQSTIRREVLGGFTTFVTMAYIIVVNPAILLAAGIPIGPGTVATILAAMFGSLLMGLFANRPLAVAPYMGENAFIAFSVGAMITAENKVGLILGMVFVSGVIFLILTVLGLRQWLAEAISPSMKFSFAVGIGLFLFFVGVKETGIISHGVTGMPVQVLPTEEANGVKQVAEMDTPPVKIGAFRDTKVLLAIGGFLLITTLLYWKIPGGILLGIFLTGVAGYFLGLAPVPTGIMNVPWSEEYNLAPIAFQLDVVGVLRLSFFPVLLTLFLVSFLDTLGTLMAVGATGDMLDEQGNLPQMERPMLVDSLSCMFAGLVGTTTSGAYIESTTGVREGARTGLSAVVVAILFGIALFFIPLLEPLQQLKYAYGPALMAVGVLMTAVMARINFQDLSEAVPALATVTMMLFTYNIANGLTAGLVLYPVIKILTGKGSDLKLGSVVLGLMCLAYYVFGVVH